MYVVYYIYIYIRQECIAVPSFVKCGTECSTEKPPSCFQTSVLFPVQDSLKARILAVAALSRGWWESWRGSANKKVEGMTPVLHWERCHQPQVCSQLQFECMMFWRCLDSTRLLVANPKVLMLRVVPFFSAWDVWRKVKFQGWWSEDYMTQDQTWEMQ